MILRIEGVQVYWSILSPPISHGTYIRYRYTKYIYICLCLWHALDGVRATAWYGLLNVIDE